MVNNSVYNTILVASHRRSGTHWTIDTIRHNFPTVNNKFITLERILPNHPSPMTIDEFKSGLEQKHEKVIIKTHLTPFEVDEIADNNLKKIIQFVFETSKIIYVVRDGRDVLNSLFYYTKSFSKKTQEITLMEFFNQDLGKNHTINKINRVEYWKLHVKKWLTKEDNMFLLKYESLTEKFNNIVQELESYLEIPKSQQIYRPELKSKGSSAIFPRKGVVGDYKQNFSEDELVFFNHTVGDLLEDLGYLVTGRIDKS